MPEIVKRFEETNGHRGPHSSILPEWLDGQIRRFSKGKDYHCAPKSFRNRLQVAANRRGMSSNSQLLKDGTILFRAVAKPAAFRSPEAK